jgi:peptide methionine sulfoxide reductase MsrA
MFEESFKGSGRLSLNSIQNNIAALKDNVFFFDEGARLTAANKLFQDLEGVLEAQRYVGSEADTAYMQAKAASEALGTVGGAKARYGGELAVKAILLQRFRNLDPKTVAKMANDPTSTYQLVRYLQGDAKQPNLAQIKAARNVGLADWATKVAQINTMFNNQDKEQTKEQQRVLGLFGL